LRRLHDACCDNHRALITELRERPDFSELVQGLLPETAV
jgi:hypothetical protein